MKGSWLSPAFGLFVVLASVNLSGQSTLTVPVGYPAIGQPPIVSILATGETVSTASPLAPAVGHKEHMEISMLLGVEMSIAGQPAPMPTAPPIVMGLDIEIISVDAEGEVTALMTGTGGHADGPMPDARFAELVRQMDERLKKVTGKIVVARDGHIVSQTIDTSALGQSAAGLSGGGIDAASVNSAIDSMRPRLPAENRGVGAKWEVRSTRTAGGLTSFEKATFEVTAIDSQSVTLKTTNESIVPAQPVTVPNLPPGATAALEGGEGKGTGTMVMRFDRIAGEVTMNQKMTMNMRIGVAAETLPMVMSTSIGTKMVGSVVK